MKLSSWKTITCCKNLEMFFPDEIPGLPPKRDIDFTIELVPGATPVSKAPYRMSTPEMLELKMQLQELLEKSIPGRVCLLGEYQFCL